MSALSKYPLIVFLILTTFSRQCSSFISHRSSVVSKSLLIVRSNSVPSGDIDCLKPLELYNAEYLERMKKGLKERKSPMKVEFERAQILKSEGIKKERQELREAVITIRNIAEDISLGIMAETGSLAIASLKAWVTGLNMTRGTLHGVDESGQDIDANLLMDVPVYIKYNSSDPNKAYMKIYRSDGFNVIIFQPLLADGEFRQYGDLPLKLF